MQNIDHFKVAPADVRYVGTDLSRPECIIAERDGTLWIADNRGAITHIEAGSGKQRLFGPQEGVPNGIAMTRDGEFIVADIGAGVVYRIDRDGNKRIVLDSYEGKRLGAVNFVYLDDWDRLWVAVSTITEPRSAALNSVVPDGYVLLMDPEGRNPRRVADGLRFTNEVRVDARGEFLYVAETTAGGISRYRIGPDGSLSGRETFGPMPLFDGAKVDGIAFDADGNLWVTEITRNQLVVLKPDGTAITVFDDPDGKTIDFPTSVTFAGEDLRTVYVGSLKMRSVASFQSPVAGAPMRHWRGDVTATA
ncbi:SMP-30/gluconolactonase/LRE family protein [Chitinasiproducens palmae]|uniref:Sugar lactone lactonase YvrE n=1 Tax=Chitinasiproducens palmae TaxID=1770053 RepID=A0A1H2PV34_9BURK|nr:SMP-30/gluconolactonase/LRE family protein [Chitinasiproducens palmae]SDV50741.1 Sugar lactone lactonase YvrE [Chitinasiproducens palmae]